MAKRTFGWVQNPGSLKTLKKVVSIFVKGSAYNSEMLSFRLPLLLKNNLISEVDYNSFLGYLRQPENGIPYDVLKGKGAKGKSRKEALCTGIVQASLDAQKYLELNNLSEEKVKIKKPYTDDWTADGYIRWAVSAGLLDYQRESDTCLITDLGCSLAITADDSEDEKDALAFALLSYPPVIRVLEILSDGELYTKFEIGSQLGFEGEMGFTSIPQEMFVAEFCEAPNQKKKDIRSNVEGDSDKYARGIASWCSQLGWVESEQKTVNETFLRRKYSLSISAYHITVSGLRALKNSKGNSSNARIVKNVNYEMLATKAPDSDYLRQRRARIINYIASGKQRSIEEIVLMLKREGIEEECNTIIDDLGGFKRIGLDVVSKNEKYSILDTIAKLDIPKVKAQKTEISEIKESIRAKLDNLDHKYLILIDLAYSDVTKGNKNSDAREFEIETANLFTKELGYEGTRLGDSDKPDVIISFNSEGTIIDNKSYKDGFSVDKHNADEMRRYIEQNKKRVPGVPSNEWWKQFDLAVSNYTFLFITSFLKGNFRNNLEEISALTGLKGGAIGVESLLYLAEDIKSLKIKKSDFFSMMNNDEIVYPLRYGSFREQSLGKVAEEPSQYG